MDSLATPITQPVSRIDAYRFTKEIRSGFLTLFKNFGYLEQQPVKISSGVDPTVRLIGSHISVLKPILLGETTIPGNGIVIAQDCIRTHNLANLGKREVVSKWGSFFQSLGTLTLYASMHESFLHAIQFFTQVLACKSKDLLVRVSAEDRDLLEVAVSHMLPSQIEIDTRSPSYYRHSIGHNEITGRNLNFALRSQGLDTYEDVGNFIILERCGNPQWIEVAMGVSTIAKQKYGLLHVLDCHPVRTVNSSEDWARRQFEDIIITSVALLHEGLRPSNRDNRTRILKSYIGHSSHLLRVLELSYVDFSHIIDDYYCNAYSGLDKLPSLSPYFANVRGVP
jgi:hypothetical protein